MIRPIDEQIDVLLNGDPYAWAMSNGYIQKGEPMMWSKIFTITQRDVQSYLQSHPVPGVDSNVGRYQNLRDGPKWRRDESGNFVIGWQERGIFTPDSVTRSEDEFRVAWTTFLVGTLGLPT